MPEKETNSSPWSQHYYQDQNGIYTAARHEYRPQAYLDALEQYKDDPQMTERLKALAAQYGSFDYRETLWDALGSGLGLWHTGWDKLRQEYAANFDSGLSDILNLKQDQEYNSPANMKRLNDIAGLNTDLQGIGDVQPTGGIPQDETPPDLSGMDAGQVAMKNSLDMLGQAVSAAFSMASGIQNVKGFKLDNALKELQGFNAGFDFNLKQLPYVFSPSQDPDTSRPLDERVIDFYNRQGLFMSRGTRKFLKQTAGLVAGSFAPDTAYNNVRGENAESVLANAGSVATMKDMLAGDESRDIGHTLDVVSDLVMDYYKDRYKLQAKFDQDKLTWAGYQNAYNDKYWKDLNGGDAAAAQNAQNRAVSAAKQYEKSEDDFWNGLISSVKGDDFWSKCLKFCMLIGRASLRNGISFPSVSSASSFNEGEGHSEWNRKGGYSENSRRGGSKNFGIHF